MEECEALCSRLAIMVNGQLKCIGNPQHLKSKFGDGHSLIVKLVAPPGENMETRVQAFLNLVNQNFPGAILQDTHEGRVNLRLPYDVTTLAAIFGIMERFKSEYGIEVYSVSQATLEQVFLHLARNQLPPSGVEITNYEKFKGRVKNWFKCRCH